MDEFNSSDQGYITLEWAIRNRIPFNRIREMESEGKIIKIDRGLYSLPGTVKDDMFILQHRYSKGIYSGITALSIHGLTDHVSENYYMTFPKGYNPSSLRMTNWHIDITRVIPELYSLGIEEILSPKGNALRVYNKERTICDVLRGQGISKYILNNAIKTYFDSGSYDIARLKEYSKLLHVGRKVDYYIDILS